MSNSDSEAIRLERVSKRYRVREGRPALAESLYRRVIGSGAPAKEVWALRDVSFSVVRGESLGLVGSNGAGKSTLLKVIAGIATSTTGRVDVRGRVCTQLDLGAGFHPYLTGRENVFLQGTILGMSNRSLRDLFPRIIEFAGLDGAIDRQLWTYSSGMIARLGFAVAAHVAFEILLLDEAISAGDSRFRRRCEDTLHRFRASGGTLIIVSHATENLRALCDRGLWLDDGRVRGWGPAREIFDRYEEWEHRNRAPRAGDKP